jgi:UDP-N-acetylglucosamine--N-acetylmuramyl-(pentapeptide) pyrophosphoryl-undecaprenol N-acetylglucosamine transferase
MEPSPILVLAAGGTGGHIFPAQVVADAAVQEGWHVHFISDLRYRDYPPAVQESWYVHVLPAVRPGRSPFQMARWVLGLIRSTAVALRLLHRHRPVAVMSFGGYPTVPTILAARCLGIPILLHEQNVVVGRVNRVGARLATSCFSHFPSETLLPVGQRRYWRTVGLPLRPAMVALGRRPYVPPASGDTVRLLVTGGSQGASVFARCIPQALALLPQALRQRLHVSHQIRPEDQEATAQYYAQHRIVAEVAPFFTDLADRLGAAHLCIGRAGASTVAESVISGCPTIFIPYPYAMDDHQTANAQSVVEAGGGWLVPQCSICPRELADRLASWLQDPALLGSMSEALRSMACPNPLAALLGSLKR